MKDTLVGVVLGFALGAMLCSAIAWAEGDSASMKMCEETDMVCLLDDEHTHAPIIFEKALTLSYPKQEPCLDGAALMDENNLSFVCEHKKWRHYQNACEVKMEAAMRAMEPYIERRAPREVGSFRSEITTTPDLKWPVVAEQWATVKRDCWRPDQ